MISSSLPSISPRGGIVAKRPTSIAAVGTAKDDAQSKQRTEQNRENVLQGELLDRIRAGGDLGYKVGQQYEGQPFNHMIAISTYQMVQSPWQGSTGNLLSLYV